MKLYNFISEKDYCNWLNESYYDEEQTMKNAMGYGYKKAVEEYTEWLKAKYNLNLGDAQKEFLQSTEDMIDFEEIFY